MSYEKWREDAVNWEFKLSTVPMHEIPKLFQMTNRRLITAIDAILEEKNKVKRRCPVTFRVEEIDMPLPFANIVES